jgi:NADH-quinone oxidoreductase subunit G
VQRIVPRPNPDVNQFWMCDRGRMEYHVYNDNRVVEATIGGREVPWREALDALCQGLSGLHGDFAVLLSPKLAIEDLLVLRRLFAELVPAKLLGGGSLEPQQPEDDILRKADPHPNSFTVRALGLTADPRHLLRDAGTRGVVIFGDDPIGWDRELQTSLGRHAFVAAALTTRNATAMAVEAVGGILLPLATHAEFAGSFANFAGRVQRFSPALSPLGSASPGYELGLEIAHTLGVPFWPRMATPQETLEAIWDRCLPAGLSFSAPRWSELPQSDLVPVAEPTARPATKGYGREPEEVAWRT